MARRIVIEEPCEVCGLVDPGEHPDVVGDWCDGSGGRRRVLEPDEYAPIEVMEGGNEYRCEFCGSRDYYGDRRANRIRDGKYVLVPLDVLDGATK